MEDFNPSEMDTAAEEKKEEEEEADLVGLGCFCMFSLNNVLCLFCNT